MKTLLLLTISLNLLCVNLFGTSSQKVGIGQKQSQNMGKGMIWGGILGGVLGNQKNKSVEGILIGGTIGAIIGSEIGKNKDYRKSQKVTTHSYTLHPNRSHSGVRMHPSTTYCNNPPYSSLPNDEIINARRDAEHAEAELRILQTKIREKQRKEKLLNDYRMRESIARQRIMDLRAIQYYEN